jgi:pimeloyl-ACP methyl ester carboxylesterase
MVSRPLTQARSHPLEIAVDGYVLRGWACVPEFVDSEAHHLGLYCLAGGGLTTGYYDLKVEGHNDYSMAHYFAQRGVVVVALDHPGAGASQIVEDIFSLTPSRVAAAHDAAWHKVAIRLSDGSLVADLPALPSLTWVGLGHSMGGMLIDVVQGIHGSFDAVIGLGHGGAGLPQFLSDDEKELIGCPLGSIEPRLVELARERFGSRTDAEDGQPDFFDDDTPSAVRDAFARLRTGLLYTCGLASIVTGSTDYQKAAITAPLFLALGDHDLLTDLAECVSRYPRVGDATLFRLAGSGHCHNIAATRVVLWERIIMWLRSVPPERTSPL